MKKIICIDKWLLILLSFGVTIIFNSCDSYVPDDLDALGEDVQYTTLQFSPYLGRVEPYTNVVSTGNKSTLPLKFSIVDIRNADGISVPELLTTKYPVKVWKGIYNGTEKSIEEIERKRQVEYRPFMEIQEKSGDITFWNSSSFTNIQTVPYEGYYFDVAIENSGGRKYQRDLKLTPLKPRAYEPSQYDNVSGLATTAYVRPSGISSTIVGERTGKPTLDVRVYINKDYQNTTPGSTLTFSVLDSLNRIIDIEKNFAETDWENLVHGFNHRFVNGKVTYDVLFPMPIVSYRTKFTNNFGNRARAELAYNRIGFGGRLVEAFMYLDFAIFEEGHWEIQFRFAGETPKFTND